MAMPCIKKLKAVKEDAPPDKWRRVYYKRTFSTGSVIKEETASRRQSADGKNNQCDTAETGRTDFSTLPVA